MNNVQTLVDGGLLHIVYLNKHIQECLRKRTCVSQFVHQIPSMLQRELVLEMHKGELSGGEQKVSYCRKQFIDSILNISFQQEPA